MAIETDAVLIQPIKGATVLMIQPIKGGPYITAGIANQMAIWNWRSPYSTNQRRSFRAQPIKWQFEIDAVLIQPIKGGPYIAAATANQMAIWNWCSPYSTNQRRYSPYSTNQRRSLHNCRHSQSNGNLNLMQSLFNQSKEVHTLLPPQPIKWQSEIAVALS